MTQEIIKLSNALCWLLQSHRALRKKEEREIWDGTHMGQYIQKLLNFIPSLAVEYSRIFLFNGDML